MEYNDAVYGRIYIREPVLLDLLASRAMHRLQGVLQHGISGLIGITSPITRFDHSVGTMLLVRRLGAPLVEQIAALLHDVSHTAFSHVIDYVFDDHDGQSYHDEVKERYVAGTDLPAVLARHGYDWHAFLHEEDFPLLEQPAPALCADRLDYFLRDIRDLKLAGNADIEMALAHLVVYEDRIVTNDLAAARWLAQTYMAADEASWANFYEVGIYELMARALRTALADGVIEEHDFWREDVALWKHLQAADHPELQAQLALVRPETRFAWDEENPDFRVSTKLRTIDPDVLLDGRLRRLSELDSEYGRQREAYLNNKKGKWPMRIVPA